MSSQRLRLKIATIALASENGRKLALQIPPGAEIVVPAGVLAGPFSGNQQIDVEWDSKIVTMFATDIRDRCERLKRA
jgi:hypothetical protein